MKWEFCPSSEMYFVETAPDRRGRWPGDQYSVWHSGDGWHAYW